MLLNYTPKYDMGKHRKTRGQMVVLWDFADLPSGNLLHSCGTFPNFLMGKSTMSMVIFHSYVTNYKRVTSHEMIDMIDVENVFF